MNVLVDLVEQESGELAREGVRRGRLGMWSERRRGDLTSRELEAKLERVEVRQARRVAGERDELPSVNLLQRLIFR